jgi:bacterioferritin
MALGVRGDLAAGRHVEPGRAGAGAAVEHLQLERAHEAGEGRACSPGLDVEEELGHARRFAGRIKELYGTPPGSMDFTAEQESLQPPADATDVVAVIKGVIDAESGAIEHYMRIIEVTDGVDWATQDMVIEILRDEEGHMRDFERFLREFE